MTLQKTLEELEKIEIPLDKLMEKKMIKFYKELCLEPVQKKLKNAISTLKVLMEERRK